jgi:hypothetical protein
MFIADRAADGQHSLADKLRAVPGLDADRRRLHRWPVTDCNADNPIASALRGWSARLLTEMPAVSTLYSLHRVLALILAVIESVNITVPLHLR